MCIFVERYRARFSVFYSGVFEDSDALGSYDISSGKWLPTFDGQNVKEILGLTLEMSEI